MDEILNTIILDENIKSEIKNAWNQKLKEAEERIREEFSTKFENDKNNIVNALEAFVNDRINDEFQKLREERDRLIKERAEFQSKKIAKIEAFENYLGNLVSKELKEFFHDKKRFMKESQKTFNMFEKFLVESLTKELSEFRQEKALLERARAEVYMEGKKNLLELRKKFIKRASKILKENVEKTLAKEIYTLRKDLHEARENHFGRKIFEAFVSEFLNTGLVKSTPLQRLKEEHEKMRNELYELRKSEKLLREQLAKTRSKLSEAIESEKRSRILNELLSPLSGEKRTVMEKMLRDVATEKLRENYEKYLPHVVGTNANDRRNTITNRKAENINSANTVIVTGNKNAILNEDISLEMAGGDSISEIVRLRKLAGLQQ